MSVSNDLLPLLVHPVYKTPLHIEGNTLTDGQHDDRFPIREQVPILLTNTVDSLLLETEQHKEEHTQFQYRTHYQHDAEVYDYAADTVHPAERMEIQRLREHIVAQMPAKAEWILDVGCGGAWLAKTLAPKGRNLISMDISDINPIKAVKSVGLPNHYGVVADVFALPFRENSIDCIVASEIIEHVSDPKRFLEALHMILKPGGRLIVTTPYNELIRTSLCIHCNRETPHNAHLYSFTERTMRHYLPEHAGKVSMKIFNSKLLVKMQLQRFLSFLPLAAWQVIDDIGNAVTGKKAYRLMVVISK